MERGGSGLKRTLGATDLVSLGIGAVIGAGIFSAIGTAAVGEVAADGTVVRYGAGPALVLSFLLLGAVCALAGLCYAELTALIPISGGPAGVGRVHAATTRGGVVHPRPDRRSLSLSNGPEQGSAGRGGAQRRLDQTDGP